MALDIQPLTPDRLPDLAELFGQGGDPRWCWCAYYRVRGMDFSAGGSAKHRKVLEKATIAGAADGRAPGLIAYDRETAVGWVSVGPREDYERLAFSRVLARVDDTPVWSIVCFVVGREARGQGVAHALLDAAIDYARGQGATTVEAYPVEVPEGERIDSAVVYKGTLSMFERRGFEIVARRQHNSASPVRPTVRLEL